MIHAFLPRLLRALAVVFALIALGGSAPASAHPELLRSNPARDALLSAPIQRIELWYSERIDIGAGSPQIELVSETGDRLMAEARVDPDDPYHVIAEIEGLDFGTWTIAWQVRSLDDGHTVTGSFAFRIGGANRAPGAATVEGERPQAWNVATRWLTFLGAALAVGAAGIRLLGNGRLLKRARIEVPGRITPLALTGVAVASLATLIEPYLFSKYPPANAVAPTLGEAIEIQPTGWLIRLIALVITTLLASAAVTVIRNPSISYATGIAAAVSLLGLSMTGHAAARENLRPVAIGVDNLHQLSIALWIGALLLIVLTWRAVGSELMSRFSLAALPVILVGILAGVLNSVFLLPELSALWTSEYGRVIIAKVVVLGGVLLLALFNRSILMSIAKAGSARLQKIRVPIRAEALLAIVVALGGAILSLLAPATVADTTGMTSLAITHYSAPAPRDERLMITLHIAPGKPGANDVGVSITDLNGNPVPPESIQRVWLDFSSLTQQTSQPNVEAVAGEDGIWRVAGLYLSIADWWRIDVNVRRAGVADDAVTEFFIVLPDPNIGGFPDGEDVSGDPAARALFDQALTSLTSLHRVSYSQQVATGSEGQVVLAMAHTNDGFDGSTPAASISTELSTSITIGSTRWLSLSEGGRWGATQSNPPVPPFEWGDEYVAAEGFRLGGFEKVNGEEAQIVTFYTPQTNLAPAYYAWWVSVETGQLLKIAMVSRVHYMTQLFSNFDGDVVIEPPLNPAGTPVATPGLDITDVGT